MISIPSLTQAQLELLRTAKKYSGKTMWICYETPITNPRKPPIKNPSFIQELVDCGLIEVESKQVLSGCSPDTSLYRYPYKVLHCNERILENQILS